MNTLSFRPSFLILSAALATTIHVRQVVCWSSPTTAFFANGVVAGKLTMLNSSSPHNYICVRRRNIRMAVRPLPLVPKEESIPERRTPNVKGAAETTRSEFLSSSSSSSFSLLLLATTTLNVGNVVRAFEGGVGGLGKTKPDTGVVFRDKSAVASFPSSSDVFDIGRNRDLTNELLGPDGKTPVFVTFNAPWPVLTSTTGIESRDLANPEAAFVQVVPVSSSSVRADGLTVDFFRDSVFASTGKFGAYGAPTDIKVKRESTSSNSSSDSSSSPIIYGASFTTLTPAMRESERKAFISASEIIGDGVFLLVTCTTAARFSKQESLLRDVAESFRAVAAPKTSFRSSQ